jgi:hypothetical protein
VSLLTHSTGRICNIQWDYAVSGSYTCVIFSPAYRNSTAYENLCDAASHGTIKTQVISKPAAPVLGHVALPSQRTDCPANHRRWPTRRSCGSRRRLSQMSSNLRVRGAEESGMRRRHSFGPKNWRQSRRHRKAGMLCEPRVRWEWRALVGTPPLEDFNCGG